MTAVPIVSEDFRRLKRDISELELALQFQVAREIAEALQGWQEDLRGTGQAPGEKPGWPIGTTRTSASGRKYYTTPDDPKGERSGRSLDSWEVRQTRTGAIAYNDARDPNTGKRYAQYVRLRGDPPGEAAEDAWELWEEHFDKAAANIEELVARKLGG